MVVVKRLAIIANSHTTVQSVLSDQLTLKFRCPRPVGDAEVCTPIFIMWCHEYLSTSHLFNGIVIFRAVSR